jgi:hypothetical protein
MEVCPIWHLNVLNCHLQGKDQLIRTFKDCFKGFQMKLALCEHQLEAINYSDFNFSAGE